MSEHIMTNLSEEQSNFLLFQVFGEEKGKQLHHKLNKYDITVMVYELNILFILKCRCTCSGGDVGFDKCGNEMCSDIDAYEMAKAKPHI